jgi:hypothetical protein
MGPGLRRDGSGGDAEDAPSISEYRSFMFKKVGKAAAGFLMAVALLFSSCGPGPTAYPAARKPTGVREPLRTGHWGGPIGMTQVDFAIEQVAERTVTVRVSGTVLRQANNRSMAASGIDNFFYDRPRNCKRTVDRKSFDCTRYTDMHIDNGMLCGVYDAPDAVYRPCLQPVR